MPLNQEVGQVFMTYAYGRTATDASPDMVHANQLLSGVDNGAALIKRWHIGGLLLLDHNPLDLRQPSMSTTNLTSAQSATTFISGMQAASSAAGDPPLLVAADQEGGLVQRLGPPLTAFPAQMALGAAPSGVALAEQEGRALGQELRQVGVNVDFAPVADVNSNPTNPVIGTRSFGDRHADVLALVAAEVRGLAAGGVAATAKHFPGHGSTSTDSHYALPLVSADLATLASRDLAPFQSAISAGAPIVMLGHLLVPALDPSTPTSLSKTVVGLLRNQLHFTGVVATDGLFMAALRQRYTDDDIAIHALQAGDDLLVQPASITTTIPAVEAAVRSGRLPKSRLDAAVRHLLLLKQRRFRSPSHPTWSGSQHAELALTIARQAITVINDCKRLLPIHAAHVVGPPLLAGRLQAALAADGVAGGGNLSVGIDSPTTDTDVTVAFDSPYPLAQASIGRTVLATYDSTPFAIGALADVLSGHQIAVGRLPVRLQSPGC